VLVKEGRRKSLLLCPSSGRPGREGEVFAPPPYEEKKGEVYLFRKGGKRVDMLNREEKKKERRERDSTSTSTVALGKGGGGRILFKQRGKRRRSLNSLRRPRLGEREKNPLQWGKKVHRGRATPKKGKDQGPPGPLSARGGKRRGSVITTGKKKEGGGILL